MNPFTNKAGQPAATGLAQGVSTNNSNIPPNRPRARPAPFQPRMVGFDGLPMGGDPQLASEIITTIREGFDPVVPRRAEDVLAAVGHRLPPVSLSELRSITAYLAQAGTIARLGGLKDLMRYNSDPEAWRASYWRRVPRKMRQETWS